MSLALFQNNSKMLKAGLSARQVGTLHLNWLKLKSRSILSTVKTK